jgi:hypothetical protein
VLITQDLYLNLLDNLQNTRLTWMGYSFWRIAGGRGQGITWSHKRNRMERGNFKRVVE